ncbi:MAG: 30S ribosomal protein S16 [Ruminobacter sp.]|jgi:small subunit ribosomal protein S16|uniref:30S ribosomal protein S16 n=1 Tax=Ruminobacter sp. TaxID=2774296 RepID=UPI001B687B2C|nr:30S ribosomal protein S16 [Ruminobacter sp.]MBP3749450.1 30S ribosomal protein S16 [Ruminobacter sp.]
MVVIRLQRGGSKKRPFYHVVVADSRRALSGRYIEDIGFYNPIAQGNEVKLNLNLEKVNEWVGKGAQLSDRVKKLVKDAKANA